MKRLVLVAGLAAGLLTAAPQGALAAPAGSSPQVEAELKRMEAYLAQLVGWSNSYVAILTQEGELLGSLNEGVATALEHFEKGDREAASAWASEWAAARRSDLRALRTRQNQLPRTPPAPPAGTVFAIDPALKEKIRRFSRIPELVDQQLSADGPLMLKMIGLVEKAAVGDENAAHELASAFFDLNIAAYEAEARQQDALLQTGVVDGHPQELVVKATAIFDRGVVESLRYMKASAFDEETDRTAYAHRVRERANELRALAPQMAPRVREGRAKLREAGAAEAPLVRKYDKALTIYEESAVSMRALADGLDAIAAHIEKAQDGGGESLGAVIDSASEPMVAFMDQDMRRRALLAGN